MFQKRVLLLASQTREYDIADDAWKKNELGCNTKIAMPMLYDNISFPGHVCNHSTTPPFNV